MTSTIDPFVPPDAGESASPRLADELARHIESWIMRHEWPVGTVLGTESELLTRFEVSRGVFRQAVSVLEQHGAARMRVGSHGGLVVIAPDPSGVRRSATMYLDHALVTATDLFSMRTLLELDCVSSLSKHLTADAAERLHAVLEDDRETETSDSVGAQSFHVLLAELTGNPAMKLFVEVLAGLTFERSHDLCARTPDTHGINLAHARILEAIEVGDEVSARRRMQRHLEAARAFHPDGTLM
ncbi:MAG: GntR family transcriptional regulator [Subtercola sp.]|nr:GntR family transcriptional regulator [Subtercola sp.]